MEDQTGKAANDVGVNKGLLQWLGSLSGILAMLACYGTLGIVALLSIMGVTVDVDEGLFVKIISFFLLLALAGMVFSWRNHRHFGPLVVTGVAVVALVITFYGNYNPWLEGAGFAGLFIASIWDLRLKKNACAVKTCINAS